MREANKRKKKFKLSGEIVRIEIVETSQGDVKVPVSVEKPQSSVRTAKKVTKKYDKFRREKAKKTSSNKKKQKQSQKNLQKNTLNLLEQLPKK